MKSMLVLSFHPAFYPPKSGGEYALYYMCKYLSDYYNVNLVSFTYPNSQNQIEIVQHNEKFKEIRVPKTKISIIIHGLVNGLSDIIECSAAVTSIESRFNKQYRKIINDEIQKADIINFFYPYLYTVPEDILKDKKIIYESQNVEYELMKKTFNDSLIGKLLLLWVYRVEKLLSEKSPLIFAVSEEDKDKLSKMYRINKNKIYISRNGVNPKEYDSLLKKNFQQIKKKNYACLFIGSYHPPNIEAIDQITKFAGKLPEIYFIACGSVSRYYLSYARDLIKESDSDNIHIFASKKICLINGFYNVEYWESIPTMWTEQQFEIKILEGIDQIEMKIYSTDNQRLEVKLDNKDIFFQIKKDWNTIQISIEGTKKHQISFCCEKEKKERKRILGVALQDIVYYELGAKFNVDLTRDYQQPYIFKNAKNIMLLGQTYGEDKLEIFRKSDIALNPMMSGSGTNIKMFDYMAAGLPIITTPIGARGIDIENYKHAIVCDVSEFPEKISEVLNNEELYKRLSNNGRKLVEEKYDWRKIAEGMAKIIEQKLK